MGAAEEAAGPAAAAVPEGAPANRPLRGILCILAGVSVFSIQDAIIKGLSGDYPVHQIVFVRSLIALPAIALLVGLLEGLARLRTRRPGLHALRAFAMFASYTTYYLALAAMPIAETVALFFTIPFFIAALSVPLLGERVGPRRWTAIGVGFLGMLIILRPGERLVDPAAALALGAAFTYGLSALLARRLGATDSGGSMAFSAGLFYLLASGALGLAFSGFAPEGDAHRSLRFLLNPWAWPDLRDFALMAACGAVSALGFLLLSQAYRLAPPNLVAPFEYVALPWGILWGYLFFATLPDAATLLGAAVIVGSGLYLLLRERGGGG